MPIIPPVTAYYVGRRQKTAAFDAVFGVVPTISAAYALATCLRRFSHRLHLIHGLAPITYGHVPYRRASSGWGVSLISVHLIGVYLTHRRASHRHASHLKGCIS
jgi:hypothetical protein